MTYIYQNGGLKLQTNFKLGDETPSSSSPSSTTSGGSFASHLEGILGATVEKGYAAEHANAISSDTMDIALQMDQFLLELSTFKALVDETKKALDRVFQEAR